MSNQFSYELDERQIRLMMLNSEADYNESAWQRFESTISTSYKPVVSTSLPKFNFSISRSVIIPTLFIGLIGGLSTLLFSFVDIKKKEEVVAEKPLQINKPVIKPKTVTAKPTVKPQVNTTPVVSAPVVKTLATNTTPESKTTTESKVVIEPSAKDIKAMELSKKTETAIIKNENAVANTVKSTESKPKKKKKQIVVEELPTITTPANLTSGNEEPELELK